MPWALSFMMGNSSVSDCNGDLKRACVGDLGSGGVCVGDLKKSEKNVVASLKWCHHSKNRA
jgi:hypothetical protein